MFIKKLNIESSGLIVKLVYGTEEDSYNKLKTLLGSTPPVDSSGFCARKKNEGNHVYEFIIYVNENNKEYINTVVHEVTHLIFLYSEAIEGAHDEGLLNIHVDAHEPYCYLSGYIASKLIGFIDTYKKENSKYDRIM